MLCTHSSLLSSLSLSLSLPPSLPFLSSLHGSMGVLLPPWMTGFNALRFLPLGCRNKYFPFWAKSWNKYCHPSLSPSPSLSPLSFFSLPFSFSVALFGLYCVSVCVMLWMKPSDHSPQLCLWQCVRTYIYLPSAFHHNHHLCDAAMLLSATHDRHYIYFKVQRDGAVYLWSPNGWSSLWKSSGRAGTFSSPLWIHLTRCVVAGSGVVCQCLPYDRYANVHPLHTLTHTHTYPHPLHMHTFPIMQHIHTHTYTLHIHTYTHRDPPERNPKGCLTIFIGFGFWLNCGFKLHPFVWCLSN